MPHDDRESTRPIRSTARYGALSTTTHPWMPSYRSRSPRLYRQRVANSVPRNIDTDHGTRMDYREHDQVRDARQRRQATITARRVTSRVLEFRLQEQGKSLPRNCLHQPMARRSLRIVNVRSQITGHIHAYNHSTGFVRRTSPQRLTTCAVTRAACAVATNLKVLRCNGVAGRRD
jgi:hypothetical protein